MIRTMPVAIVLTLGLLIHAMPTWADLSTLSARLAAVRATHGANQGRDAGPELTPVTRALREWVERQLPPPAKTLPGGMVESLGSDDLRVFSEALNRTLDGAGLTCGALASPTYRCADAQENDHGYLGKIAVGRLGSKPYLTLITGVGVRCGSDQSLYVYEPTSGGAWRLIFSDERDAHGRPTTRLRNSWPWT